MLRSFIASVEDIFIWHILKNLSEDFEHLPYFDFLSMATLIERPPLGELPTKAKELS